MGSYSDIPRTGSGCCSIEQLRMEIVNVLVGQGEFRHFPGYRLAHIRPGNTQVGVDRHAVEEVLLTASSDFPEVPAPCGNAPAPGLPAEQIPARIPGLPSVPHTGQDTASPVRSSGAKVAPVLLPREALP